MSRGVAPTRQPFEPELRDELLDLAQRDFDAVDALDVLVDADPALAAELDARLADPAVPAVAALAAWVTAPDEARSLVAITTENMSRLAEIVATHGWPGLTRVGAMGADTAWIIAQHADAANEQRRALLEPLRAAVDAGEADPRHYACLVDRVAAIDGVGQTFGTIVVPDGPGARFPVPLDDPDHLDERRQALGLRVLADELPHLTDGDLIPYGADRRRAPLLAWPTVLEGHRSVEAALEADVRRIKGILAVRPGDRRLGRLRWLARQRDVEIRAVEPEVIDALVSGDTHGGVAAIAGTRRYIPLEDLLAPGPNPPLLVMLDGIEDPYNFGQAIRALHAAGVDGLVLGPRSWENAAATVARASAGASELLPTARVADADDAVRACRTAGLQVVCAVAGPEAQPLDAVDLRPSTLMVIGGERRGIGATLRADCDLEVAITYGRPDAPPLGTAAAAAVLAFEALRQRRATIERPFDFAAASSEAGERS